MNTKTNTAQQGVRNAKLAVGVHANSNVVTVAIHLKQGEITTVLYAQDHPLNRETVGIVDVPSCLFTAPSAAVQMEELRDALIKLATMQKKLIDANVEITALNLATSAKQDSGPSAPTDISAQLREYAANPGYSHNDYADVMRVAADECERFYGGMMAWKKTAETKDRKLSEEMTARINERVAARIAEQQPDSGRNAAQSDIYVKAYENVMEVIGNVLPETILNFMVKNSFTLKYLPDPDGYRWWWEVRDNHNAAFVPAHRDLYDAINAAMAAQPTENAAVQSLTDAEIEDEIAELRRERDEILAAASAKGGA